MVASLIETRDLGKDYALGAHVVHALRGVSVSIARGEMLAIMGPSGSGKSTFIRTINRLERHDKGVIVVDDDVDVFNMAAVIHAFSTKCHPVRGYHPVEYTGRANALTPAYSLEERVARKGASVAFDSTWPSDWPRKDIPIRATLDAMYSPQVQKKVLARWKKLGL